MTSSADRLLQFVIEHEGCGQQLEVGHLVHDSETIDIVLRCPGCNAGVAIPVTVGEASSFVQNTNLQWSDADILQALAHIKKH
jgi:hypothetical protein